MIEDMHEAIRTKDDMTKDMHETIMPKDLMKQGNEQGPIALQWGSTNMLFH
jgi:hypothetical protein